MSEDLELKTDISEKLVDLGRDWEPTTLKDALLFFEDEVKRLEIQIEEQRLELTRLSNLLATHKHDLHGRACAPL